jgi:hypothetical protein
MDIALSDDGEFVITDTGDLTLISGVEEAERKIVFAVQMLKGEWALDESRGLDQWAFLGQKGTVEKAQELIKREISQVEGISKVEIQCSLNQRNLQVSFKAYLNSGETVASTTSLG